MIKTRLITCNMWRHHRFYKLQTETSVHLYIMLIVSTPESCMIIFRFHSLFIVIKFSFWHESLCLPSIHLCHVLIRGFFNNLQITFFSNTFTFPRCLPITKNNPVIIVSNKAKYKWNWIDNVWCICPDKTNNNWPHHLNQVFADRCWSNYAANKSNLPIQ